MSRHTIFRGGLSSPENPRRRSKEAEIHARREVRTRADAAHDGLSRAPLACPQCRMRYPIGEECPDCGETLIEEQYLDAAGRPSEYADSGRGARFLVILLGIGVVLCGGGILLSTVLGS